MSKAAIFWDRDGTLIEDPGYLSDPDQIKFMPGAIDALKSLRDAGFENIIVTNQSGIARGYFDEVTLERIHEKLKEMLAAEGASIDAIYYCPYLDGDEAVVEQYRQDSDLRKPKPGMLLQASLERNLDLSASWCVGDSFRDTQAGKEAGCRTILLDDGKSGKKKDRSIDFTAESLEKAVEIISRYTRRPENDQQGGDHAIGSADRTETVSLLREILNFLRMVDRRSQAEDFSLAQLVGSVIQILAIAAVVYAVFASIRDLPLGIQIIRLLYALILQLLALSCFVLAGVTKK